MTTAPPLLYSKTRKEGERVFNTYEFTFAGESSVMYGMFVADFGNQGQSVVSFGNVANIVETRTSTRVRPIHYGVKYNEKPLTFKLVFGSDKPLDRYEMENIAMWLTGHQGYQWLTIGQEDLEHVAFRCIVKSLTPIMNGWLPVAFEAEIVCDCPYAYGLPFERTYTISGETAVLFRNNSSVREYIKPKLTISLKSGETKFSICNKSDNGRIFEFTGLPPTGLTITVDTDTCVMQEESGEYNPYDYCNMVFFRLVPGDNDLVIKGNGTLKMTGRQFHNVSA